MIHFPSTVAEILAAMDRDHDAFSQAVEFDHPFTVHTDGTVTDGPAGVYAPDLRDDTLSDGYNGQRWTLVNGYSGQDRYAGPVMHNSEFLGGRMARDVLTEPGTYVAIAAYWTPELPNVDDDWPVTELSDDDAATDRVTCGECGRSWDDAIVTSMTPAPSARCPFEPFHAADEDDIEGWALARLDDDHPDNCGYCAAGEGMRHTYEPTED